MCDDDDDTVDVGILDVVAIVRWIRWKDDSRGIIIIIMLLLLLFRRRGEALVVLLLILLLLAPG
jgi:hypothetical protein